MVFTVIVLSLIAFGVYKLVMRSAKNAELLQRLSEEDLRSFFDENSLAKEERARKQWFNFFYIRIAFYTLVMLLGCLLTWYSGENFSYTLNDSSNDIHAFSPIAHLIGLFLGCWILYQCAYKKRGTALLMYGLIISPFVTISDIGKIFKEPAVDKYIFFFDFLIFSAILSIEIFYWIKCLRLYRVNSYRKNLRASILEQKHLTIENALPN